MALALDNVNRGTPVFLLPFLFWLQYGAYSYGEHVCLKTKKNDINHVTCMLAKPKPYGNHPKERAFYLLDQNWLFGLWSPRTFFSSLAPIM